MTNDCQQVRGTKSRSIFSLGILMLAFSAAKKRQISTFCYSQNHCKPFWAFLDLPSTWIGGLLFVKISNLRSIFDGASHLNVPSPQGGKERQRKRGDLSKSDKNEHKRLGRSAQVKMNVVATREPRTPEQSRRRKSEAQKFS